MNTTSAVNAIPAPGWFASSANDAFRMSQWRKLSRLVSHSLEKTTTEVWTWRGLVTYYTVFVIDLASRRVQIVDSGTRASALC